MAPKKKILIVDDDSQITDLLADFCLDRGYEVETLNDSRQVVAKAREWKPDLVTLDLEMPGKDGTEVLKELRAFPETCTLPVIIVSVVAHEAALAPGSIQGLFDKPIKLTNLLQQIQKIITANSPA